MRILVSSLLLKPLFMKQLKHSLTIIKTLKVLTFMCLAVFLCTKLSAQQIAVIPPQKTISVNGSAQKEVTPDEIYVQVSLREYDRKGGGKVDIETIKNNFLAACKSIGLNDTDVVVQSYNGWDGNWWWYKKKKKENPDLKAGITYWVKVASTSKMDELVNKMDDEATQSFGIAKTDYSKMEELRKQLKIEAIQAAKEKAAYLAAAINEQVGGAIAINEPNEVDNYPRPMYSNMMLKEAAVADNAAPPMNVDFKKMKVQFDVNVVFALK
ncbi:DUF541 domain-containing protein [Ilyomonas limi]|uniref:DUF541 domain-containing protein n=2 Tax=Ilyomonas limi TaxID=2575867 RepID=A0A4U3L0L4_9BACT|nr:DUF541 domain-containing protein [Ilyomonas limi]